MTLFPRLSVYFLAALGLFTMISLTTTACAPDPCVTNPAPAGLAVAVGDRANSPKPFWPDEIEAELAAIADGPQGRGVTLVRVDGRPTIGCVKRYENKAKNPPAWENNKKQFKVDVRDEAARMRAAAPEANPLAALSQASAAAGKNGTVALIDSGLQTVAPLDFRANHLLDANIDRVVAALAKTGALPDLHDRKVILAGIGYTAPPQAQLGENQRAHLIELWQKIVTAAGAKPVIIITSPNTTEPNASLPKVSEVPVPPPDELQLGCNMDSILSDDGDVGFLPDSTNFRDEPKARATLAKIANWLRENPMARGTVTGSIAHWGTDEGNGGLSRNRAIRVRDALVSLGARGDQLAAEGAGWGPFPTKIAPHDDTSDKLNRRVVVHLTCG